MDKTHTTPKDFFLYVGAVIALYVSAGSLLALLFAIINAVFPDAVNPYYNFYTDGMRFAIASLIIVFPLYVFLSWAIRRDVIRNPQKRDLGIRKWLLYLTLFVAGLAVVGDLITVLNVFLGGELTVRFISKVIAVLAVSGAVFGYYLYDLKRSAVENKTVSRSIIAAAFVLVLASLVWGFSVMGSPTTARNIRFDETRVSDLRNLQNQIVNVWQQKGILVTVLTELEDSISYGNIPVDPETSADYVYKKTGKMSFELCATFARDTTIKDAKAASSPAYPYYYDELGGNWEHVAGNHCFERNIDPELYPVHKNMVIPAIPVRAPVLNPDNAF